MTSSSRDGDEEPACELSGERIRDEAGLNLAVFVTGSIRSLEERPALPTGFTELLMNILGAAARAQGAEAV